MDEISLYRELLDCGLVQFGMFGAEEKPCLIQIGLLPSYPLVLKQLALCMRPLIPENTERLLSVSSAYGLGVALSLDSNVPLVYSLGTDGNGVSDIIGAYDVGHPTCLVMDVWQGENYILPLIQKAEGVGLKIHSIVCCFSIGQPEMNSSTIPIQSSIDVVDMVDLLIEHQALSPAMRLMLED